MSKIYRLYVDEVSNTDIHGKLQENQRYLSLTGLIFELNCARETVFPVIEKLKQDFFDSHPDSPVVLHRKELVNKKYPFHTLRDPDKENAFNGTILGPRNIYRTRDQFVAALGLPHATLHEMRKASASFLTKEFIKQGKYSPKILQRFLGHTRPDEALKIYTLVFEGDYAEAVFDSRLPVPADF